MKTYSEREVFSEVEMHAFRDASLIVEALPSVDARGRELRCHEVARVVAIRMDADLRDSIVRVSMVTDGRYEIGAEHSWIALPSGHVLDVYAVGRVPAVQLVFVGLTMPNRFVPGRCREDIRYEVIHDLLAELRKLRRAAADRVCEGCGG